MKTIKNKSSCKKINCSKKVGGIGEGVSQRKAAVKAHAVMSKNIDHSKTQKRKRSPEKSDSPKKSDSPEKPENIVQSIRSTKKRKHVNPENDPKFLYITNDRQLSFPAKSFAIAFRKYTLEYLESVSNDQINNIYTTWREGEATARSKLRQDKRNGIKRDRRKNIPIRYDSPVDFVVSPKKKGDIIINKPPVGFTPIKLPPPNNKQSMSNSNNLELFPPFEEQFDLTQTHDIDINDLIEELEKNESK